ncbi:TPA: hypothetical protein ACH3X3_003472 [Trebouxia sp. C0006]
MNGAWDRWVAVTLNYHKEVASMLRALDGPLFSMAGQQPPHLIIARLLEPVHEALLNNGQPDDVLLTSIWRLAGQVLLDVPDCPVQLAQAVYTLMGKDPPEHLLNSLVRQVSARQARTAEALEAVSLTAQTVRQHQLAQASQQAVASAQPPSTASAATDGQSAQPEQDSAFQLLQSVMATVASSNEAAMAPEHAPVVHMIGAVMAPVVQMLKDEQQKEHAMHRASMDQLLQQNRQLSQQLDSVEQNSWQLGLEAAGQISLGAVPSVQQPINTPQRKKMRKADDAWHVARKHVLAVDERLDEQGPSAGPVQAPTVLGQRQTAPAMLTGPIANGVQTVYPGKAGEEL